MLLLLLASALGARLAERAGDAAGLASVRQISRSVNDDCSGFVRAVYGREGIDLSGKGLREKAGENGTSRMHRLARARRALRRIPRPGDLVFFRDTWRKGLSHVGIVERVRGSSVTFVHRSRKGILRSRLDLRRPHERARNDVLRRGPRPALTGELLVGFAAPDRLPLVGGAASPSAAAGPSTSTAALAARSPAISRRTSRP